MMFLAPIAAFCITGILLLVILRSPLKDMAIDQPNQRSLHTVPIPRTGGMAIMLGILFVWYVCLDTWLWASLALALLLLSVMDDMRGLSVKWRFIIQILICAIFAVHYFEGWHWWLSAAAIIALVWMINLYNFMDGSDGLACGMALFGFSSYACVGIISGNATIALIGLAIAGASLAFLIFNFHPAKIFMGDGGAVPLGFLAGSIGVYGWQQQLWPLWFPFIVFSPFIVDATLTLFKRLLKKEKIWQPHRSHYYQRLVQMGWGHKKTALAEYCLMAIVAVMALIALRYPALLTSFALIWLLLYVLLLAWVDHRWKKFSG